MRWQDGLKKWRKDRSITEPQSTYRSMMLEEDDEYNIAVSTNNEHEIIDAICDMAVVNENQRALECKDNSGCFISFNSLSDALRTYEFEDDNCSIFFWIDKYLHDLAKKHGYNLDLALKLTVKHISSRQQDPKQKARWEKQGGNIKGEKWLKNKNQDPETIYQPDYSKCKLPKK